MTPPIDWSATIRSYVEPNPLRQQTDALGRTTQYHYNGQQQLKRVTNAMGEHWDYQYDPSGRVIASTDFAGIKTRYAYDVANRLVSTQHVDGSRINYHYDELDQLIKRSVTESNGERHHTHWAYDKNGDLIDAKNDAATITFKRDDLGRILEESLNGEALTSEYQTDGLRSSVKGKDYQEQHHYEQLNQLTELSLGDHQPLTFDYTKRGQEKSRHNEHGFQHQQPRC